MADQKLSELTFATGAVSSDLLYVVQGATSKKIAFSSVVSSISALIDISSYATKTFVTAELTSYTTNVSLTSTLNSYTTNANLTSTLASFTVTKLQYSSLTVQLDSSGSVTLPNNAQIKDNANTSVSFGYGAGVTNQAANTIIFNASGSTVNGVSGQTSSFYVAPIRQFSSISAYATNRVLQYNETTKEITYSNKLDAVSPYITGYGSEVHVSPVALDDTGNGTIGDPVKTIARAQVLAAAAFETTGVGERKTIVLHPGNYTENVTIDTQYTVLTTHELVGKNTTLSGTLTVTKGCTIDGLKMNNLVITASSANGTVDIIGCTVSTAVSKTSSAYTVFRGCDLSTATLSVTGNGTVVMVGGNYFTVAVNNSAAAVLAKAVISMGPVTLTAGTLQLADTLIYSATNTSNAITQSAGSFLTVNNCQTLIPNLTNVSRNSFGGYYSILHSVYDKPNSTFTGVSLNAISYSQYINADRLILSAGGDILNSSGNSVYTTNANLTSTLVNYVTNANLTSTLAAYSTADTFTSVSVSSGILTLNFAYDYAKVLLNQNVVNINFVNAPTTGYAGTIVLEIEQNGTGGYTVAGSSFLTAGGVGLIISATASATSVVSFTTRNGGDRIFGISAGRDWI